MFEIAMFQILIINNPIQINPMKPTFVKVAICLAMLFSFSSCKKALDSIINKDQQSNTYVEHTIAKGQHSSNISNLQTGEYAEINFTVRFDSSAVYSTVDASNQLDINKLYGFSDNDKHHHEYSARFGWRWSAGALRLFAYNYNDGIVSSKELGTVEIGKEIECGIRVDGANYVFILNGRTTSMPRAAKTALAKGYRLFPYFGGDEPAPHNIRIWIKEK